MNPLIVYVAGPYSAPDAGGVERNVRAALDAGKAVLDRGHWPLIPHLTHWFDAIHPHPYEVYIDWTLALIDACDALLFLGPSPGADGERAYAERNGIPVYESGDDLPWSHRSKEPIK